MSTYVRALYVRIFSYIGNLSQLIFFMTTIHSLSKKHIVRTPLLTLFLFNFIALVQTAVGVFVLIYSPPHHQIIHFRSSLTLLYLHSAYFLYLHVSSFLLELKLAVRIFHFLNFYYYYFRLVNDVYISYYMQIT